MKNNIEKKISSILFSSIILVSCSQKIDKFDIDLSNLPKPNKPNFEKKENSQSIQPLDKGYIDDLIPLKDKEQILSQFKFGKNDPFSESEFQLNQLTSNLKLTGFLNTKVEKYVFVNYLGKEGTISEKSVGGLNTNVLPEGAKVIDIDTKDFKLTIEYKNEKFIFEL